MTLDDIKGYLIAGGVAAFAGLGYYIWKPPYTLQATDARNGSCKLVIKGKTPTLVELYDRKTHREIAKFHENELIIVNKFSSCVYAKVYGETNIPHTTSSVHVKITKDMFTNLNTSLENIENSLQQLGTLSLVIIGGKGTGKSNMIISLIDFFISQLGFRVIPGQYRARREEFVSANSKDHVTSMFKVVRLEKQGNNQPIVIEIIDSPGFEKNESVASWYAPDLKNTLTKIMDGHVRINSCVFGARNVTLSQGTPDECIPKPMLALVCSSHDAQESGNANDKILNILKNDMMKKAYSVSTKFDEAIEKIDDKVLVMKSVNGELIPLEDEDTFFVKTSADLQFFSITEENMKNKFGRQRDLWVRNTTKFIEDVLYLYKL